MARFKPDMCVCRATHLAPKRGTLPAFAGWMTGELTPPMHLLCIVALQAHLTIVLMLSTAAWLAARPLSHSANMQQMLHRCLLSD